MDQAPAIVSTGPLPPEDHVRALVRASFEWYRGVADGEHEAGHGLRGQLATSYLSRLGLDLFASEVANGGT